jgi:hypothetical protein
LKRSLAISAAIATLILPISPAIAQSSGAQVLPGGCGTAGYGTNASGQVTAGVKPLTQNSVGQLCAGSSSSGGGSTHAQSSALAANLVVKATAGTLYSFEVNADSTLSGAAWWVMIYDATSAPGDGAVTPAKCYGIPSGTTQMGATFASSGVNFTSGMVIGVSTTGCFTKTASTHAFIGADFQ